MTRHTPSSQFFPINGKKIHVVHWPSQHQNSSDSTDNPDPILLLHATGFHARCWDQVIHQLPDVPVFAVDLPCHGKSDSIAPPYRWQQFADYIEVLLDELKLTRITAVGHSFGGHLVSLLAAKKPELFNHLVLLDPVIGDPEHMKIWQVAAQHESPVAKRRNQWASVQEFQQKLEQKIPFNEWSKAVLTDYCRYGLTPSSNHEGYQLACDPVNEAAIYSASGGSEIYQSLPNITTATTIIRAKERQASDALFDFRPSPTWNKLVTELPNATETYCEDRTHFFPMEDPTFVADIIKKVHTRSLLELH